MAVSGRPCLLHGGLDAHTVSEAPSGFSLERLRTEDAAGQKFPCLPAAPVWAEPRNSTHLDCAGWPGSEVGAAPENRDRSSQAGMARRGRS